MRQQTTGNKGFTLIELLIVIGIIGFLAAAVLVAVDPVKRIQDSRDARRFSEVNAILNAILTKQVDDRALFNGLPSAPVVSGTVAQVIVTSDSGVECDTPATAPLCPTAAVSTVTGKGCVANLGGQLAGTATSTGTTVDGTGTAFTTEVVVGDVLLSAAGSECTVSVIVDAVEITCSNTPSPAFSGTVINKTRSIVPNYIATIPVDPRGAGTTPTVGNLAFGVTNSGYYVRRNTGNRLEIGSCYPEQTTAINVQR